MTEKTTSSSLRHLRAGGALLIFSSVALFTLLQSHSLWSSPTLVPDRWPELFYPFKDAFPREWTLAQPDSALGMLNALLFLIITSVMFAAYLITVRCLFLSHEIVSVNRRVVLGLILGVTAAVLLIFFLVPGMFSSDLFSYISYGRMSAVYGDNPLLSTPGDYAWYDRQEWIQWVVWRQTPSAYGPAWVMLAHILAIITNTLDGDIVTHLLSHKVLASIAHLLNVALLWRVAGIVFTRFWQLPAGHVPGDASRFTSVQAAITLTYAWNPLALIEFGVSGHNDVLIITSFLAAIWLYLSGYWRAAAVAIALGGLVKVTAFIFLPGYIWLLLWEKKEGMLRGLWRATQAVILVAVTCVVAYMPFWAGSATLTHLSGGPAAHFFIHSLGSIIRFKLAEGIALLATGMSWQPAAFWTSAEIGWRLDWPARWGLLLISATAAVLATWKARSFPTMVGAWCWTLLFYLTIGSVWYWPWYATWLLIPAALLGPGRAFTAVQILCASSLAVYALWPTVAPPLDWLTGWTGLIVTGLPLLYLGITAMLDRRQRAMSY